MNPTKSELDLGILIRRSLFFLILVLLALTNLFVMFRGLSSPQAMDQAQIAREVSRGNGMSTKFIRPADYHLAEQKEGRAVPLEGFKDTYHAPLNIWVNAAIFKMIGADDPTAFEMGDNQMVYQLDRVVVTVSTIFFLLAIGVNYLLIARIFDPKIAGVCALLMLFCQTFWEFSLSGLPQMLMLFLFSCGIYFVYRAIEAMNEQRVVLLPALLAGVFFTLLAMTHWVAVWVALGYILFAAIVFHPRGLVGASLMVLLLLAGGFCIMRNLDITGQPFGSAFIARCNGLGNSEELVEMRNVGPYIPEYNFKSLISMVARAVLSQTTQIIPLLGGIIVAPLFFLALLHPFKSKNIGMLRWAVLAMWITGALGLAFFGISNKTLDPNQIHLLFAPLMTAYGVAFISILWTRLEIVGQIPMLRNLHLILICLLCAMPLVLAMPRKVDIGLETRARGGIPHWPPYYPAGLQSQNGGLRSWVKENEIVFSDQPWAVAWYADRVSIWLPATKEDFIKLENVAVEAETPPTGILITPSSHGMNSIKESIHYYRDFAALVVNGGVIQATNPPGFPVHDKASKISEVTSNYPNLIPLLGLDMILYSDRRAPSTKPE